MNRKKRCTKKIGVNVTNKLLFNVSERLWLSSPDEDDECLIYDFTFTHNHSRVSFFTVSEFKSGGIHFHLGKEFKRSFILLLDEGEIIETGDHLLDIKKH